MMNKAAARGSVEVEALLRDRMRWAERIVASEKGTRGETRKLSQYGNSALVGRAWRRGKIFLKRRYSMVGQGRRRRGAYEVEKGQDNVFCSPALAPSDRGEERRRERGEGPWSAGSSTSTRTSTTSTSTHRGPGVRCVSLCEREGGVGGSGCVRVVRV